MCFQAVESALLIRTHQPRIAGHIGGQDCGKTALDRLPHGLPQPQR
jgi:hypothetical protein